MKLQTSLSIAFFSSLCLLTAAGAQQRVDGYRVYYSAPNAHEGFHFSFAAGFGGGDFQEKNFQGPDKLEMSGGSSHIDVKVGGAISKNLILTGDFIGSSMLWPKTKIGNIDQGRSDGELRQGLIGLGLTYYIMPANVFLSGTVGAGGFTYTTEDTDYESDRGLGLQLKVGKEWWVSPQWGVGLSVFYLNQHVNEPNNQDLDAGFLGVMLNTSFN